MNNTEKHAILWDAGWRVSIGGNWVSPDGHVVSTMEGAWRWYTEKIARAK